MGTTGESDRKRHHFSSISPMAATTAKNHPILPTSEDKKLDVAILQYQNQKLTQKLEVQKVEYRVLENKVCQLVEQQQPCDVHLTMVNNSWKELVNELESRCLHIRKWSNREDDMKEGDMNMVTMEDEASSSFKDAFLSRLAETGATQSSSADNSVNQMEEDTENSMKNTKNVAQNVAAVIENLWFLNVRLHAKVVKELPEYDSSRKRTSTDLCNKVEKLRLSFNNQMLEYKSASRELQSHQDMDAKNRAKVKRLRGDLESIVSELEESKFKLVKLKAERDAAKGASFPLLNIGSKPCGSDKMKDKQKDLQGMEFTLKESTDEASCQLTELKRLHEDKIKIIQQLSDMQNMLKNVKSISSSQAYLLVKDQIEKSKAEIFKYQALLEKLQVEKDILVWREKELSVKNDAVDAFKRSSGDVDAKINDLRIEIRKQIDGRKPIEAAREEASREPGRQGIVAEFRTLVSSFPEEMGIMQTQLRNYKEAACDVHSLRADKQSLAKILDRKVKEFGTTSTRFADQDTKRLKLQSVVKDLKENDLELELILEMYKRESTDFGEVLEARDLEYKAWACVQNLKTSLDEHNLELRVKIANEAEAISQQKLAAAEAEIAELRQKLEASKRDRSKLSHVLKSKSEENEAYLSEIETIGHVYDEMQTQNQHLLQQITERDDYNIKLVLEGVRARQVQGALLMEKQYMDGELQKKSTSLSFYEVKAARIGEQLRSCSDQIIKLAEDKVQRSATLDNTQKRQLDVKNLSLQMRESLDESQSEVESSRVSLSELQIELASERFEKKRIEEDLEVVRKKAWRLRAQIEGSSVLKKLQEELKEYREILKCSICLNKTKEVVIKKCFHLFCNHCIQKILESRHRKCPECNSSFGANDVKPIYI